MVGALRDRRIEVFGHHATRIGGGSPEELARYIRNFFDVDPVHSHYIVYYTGRAQVGTGDWAVSSPRFSFADMMAAWQLSAACAAGSRLVIIADCSHSGAWADELADNPAYAQLSNVAVQASALASQAAGATIAGGEFTQTWLDGLSLNVNRRIVSVGTAPTPLHGLAAVQHGSYAENEASRPAILIAPWLPQLNSLLALVQTPLAYAKWAMRDEVVIHCGRRMHLLNVAAARHISTIHELEVDELDGSHAPAPECRVS